MEPLIQPNDRFVLRCFAVFVLVGLAITIYNPGWGMFYFLGTFLAGLCYLVLSTIGLILFDWFAKD